MATTTSVQRPTTYNATHKENEYNPISFKFVPIPNSQATSEDLAYDLGDECKKYYSIDKKSFYLTIAPSGAEGTLLNETFPSSNQEHVLYAVPNTNSNVIYKLKSNNTETYKCSANGVKTLSFGNAELIGKSINTISIGDIKVQTRTDGELLVINSDYTDTENTVNSINSDGFIYVEVPIDLDIDYIEVKSNVLYLKGNFSSSYGNSALSNLYVCKYSGENNEYYCTYSSDSVFPVSVVSSSENKIQIKLGSSTVQFIFEYNTTRYFLKVNNTIETGDSTVNLSDWEASGEEENSDYLLYKSYVKIGKKWYLLSNVSYSVDDTTKSTTLAPKSAEYAETESFDDEWKSNPQYIKKIMYMKTVKVSEVDDDTKTGIFSRVQNKFLSSSNISHLSEVQNIIQGMLDSNDFNTALSRYKSLDTDNKLVIDTVENNKVIFSDPNSNVSNLNYRLENTSQDSGTGN